MMMGNGNELDQHNGMYITVQPNQIYQHSNYHDDYQPHDYQQPIIGGGHGSMSEEPTHSAPKQRQVKVACVGCKKACKKCDNAR